MAFRPSLDTAILNGVKDLAGYLDSRDITEAIFKDDEDAFAANPIYVLKPQAHLFKNSRVAIAVRRLCTMPLFNQFALHVSSAYRFYLNNVLRAAERLNLEPLCTLDAEECEWKTPFRAMLANRSVIFCEVVLDKEGEDGTIHVYVDMARLSEHYGVTGDKVQLTVNLNQSALDGICTPKTSYNGDLDTMHNVAEDDAIFDKVARRLFRNARRILQEKEKKEQKIPKKRRGKKEKQ